MPKGTKVRLAKSDDYALPLPGATGVIEGNNAEGDPVVRWDGIKGISIIFPGSVIEKI